MKTVWIILITIASTLLAAGLLLLLSRPQHGQPVLLQPPPTEPLLLVHVAGEVVHPGVYALPRSSRVHDAIQSAGGALEEADVQSLNLAALVEDGSKIYVPPQPGPGLIEPVPDSTGSSPAPGRLTQVYLASVSPTAQFPVNINTATQEESESLPSIGPVTAQKIIAYRQLNGPFTMIEDIQKVAVRFCLPPD